MMRYDAIIIGSGPAGLEAAINLKIRKKNFLLFGTSELSRKLSAAPHIDNYLGLPGITGAELQQRMSGHIDSLDIAITHEQVQMIYPMGEHFVLNVGTSIYESITVILAPGAFSAKLFEGEEQFLGRGVGYCATCDAPLYKGKTVAVLGEGEEALRETEFITGIAAKTYYLPLGPADTSPAGAEILSGKVTGIDGDTVVRSLQLEDRAIAVDGVFILREMVAPSSLLPGLAVQDGFIRVEADMSTNIPGCYAAGDCTGKPHQYMRAAGQGQTAALNAVTYIDKKNANTRKGR